VLTPAQARPDEGPKEGHRDVSQSVHSGSDPILVAFAVREELRPFRKRAGDLAGWDLLLTGMGSRNAEWAIGRAWERRLPGFVLTCGFAGGLNPALAGGAVLFATDEGSRLPPVLRRLGASPATFQTVDRVIATAAEKRELWRSTGADAVEMESGVVRSLCRDRGIPSATVRVISDTAAEDLPLDFNRLVGADGRLRYARLATALARSPASLPALLRLRRQTRFAAERLADVLVSLTADRSWWPAPGGGAAGRSVSGSR
jgi:nucleoside phosphorylase